jgi:hypothetical protein
MIGPLGVPNLPWPGAFGGYDDSAVTFFFLKPNLGTPYSVQ